MTGTARRTALVALGVSLALGMPSCGAEAAVVADDINHNGNGTHNHNAFSIRSPTFNSGIAPGSNANAGGTTNTPRAKCKKVKHCIIRQREVFFLP
jgi:hypothetical protein